MALALIRGGRWAEPVRRTTAYTLDVNCCGVVYVWFRRCPTRNVFECVMRLSEAIERGFLPAETARVCPVYTEAAR